MHSSRKRPKIDRGVPIPPKQRNRSTEWLHLTVGASCVVPGNVRNVSARVTSWGKRNAPTWQFTCRTVADGVRVWRIA